MLCLSYANRTINSKFFRNYSREAVKVTTKTNATYKTDDKATAINDRDIFGTLSESGRRDLDIRYADESLPAGGYREEFDIEARKNAYYYKQEITKFARQGAPGLRRALELYQEMKAKARLRPTMDNISPLIYGCAKAGYTKRAFDLYDESMRYLPKVSNSIITCLINSCGECPFPEYGLARLRWFLPHIKANSGKQLNEIHYNCAIKAFGKLGQLDEASNLVQEMIDQGVMPTLDTFNMLFIGCASNKDAGCSIALRVFKRLKMYEFKPTVVTYRLLLRCIRDCGMGSSELIREIIQELPAVASHDQRLKYQSLKKRQQAKRPANSELAFTWLPLMSDIGVSIKEATEKTNSNPGYTSLVKVEKSKKEKKAQPIKVTDVPVNNLQDDLKLNVSASTNDDQSDKILNEFSLTTAVDQDQQTLPNLLSDDHLDLVMRIRAIRSDELKMAKDRILLFGGFYGYLETMMKDGCLPDRKTFSLMLDCIEGTKENYLLYHKLAEDLKIERDLLFYDLLIRHVCKYGVRMNRLELALEFLEKMHQDNLRPNISTFESLAPGCNTWFLARRLLNDINKCGFIPSYVLVVNLFTRAMSNMDFRYVNKLIDFCCENNFQVGRELIDRLEELRLRAGELIHKQEKSGPRSSSQEEVKFDEQAIRSFDIFRYKFRNWLMKVDVLENDHPWSQFKVDTSSKRDGMRKFEKHLNVMNHVKRETLKLGQGLGNLSEKARKIIQSQA